MRILLGVPTRGNPTKAFLTSLASLELPSTCTSFEHATIIGDFVPGQRELIARRAMSSNADFLLMIDDDMVVPPDAVRRLLAILERDPSCALAGALYYGRDGIRPMVVDGWSSTDTTLGWIPAFAEAPVRVDGVGFGCVLVRVSALRALEPPLYDVQIYIEDAASRVRLCNEDYLLCERLRGLGLTIVLDAGLRCGHFDRDKGRPMPDQWEPIDVTNRRRMMVVEPGPRFVLVDYDESVGRVSERQERGNVIYVDAG